jgi:4-hydroxy-tetrahydrodipicolinate reductase
MRRLNVCVAGATGWVGRPLCLAVSAAEDLTLAGAISRTHRGRKLGDVLGAANLDVKVSGSVAEALDAGPCDVFVDYTKADAVKANVLAAIGRGVHVVVGSSGLTDDDFAEIDRAAAGRGVGVVAAGNFAITAVLLQRFAREAAKYLAQWEIIDYASDSKPDAPSGTARELAHRLSEIRRPEPTRPVGETVGEPASRGATLSGTQVHSLRLPGYVIGVEAIFGAPDERLSIRHDAGSGAGPYIKGTLLAVRRVRGRVGLARGLDAIMD